MEITPSNDRVHQMVDVVLKHGNCVLRKVRSVFLVEDIIDSLKFVILFWCLTYIGAWFNGLTLVILFYLSAFSLPIVYEMHKAQIDQVVGMAVQQVQDVVATYVCPFIDPESHFLLLFQHQGEDPIPIGKGKEAGVRAMAGNAVIEILIAASRNNVFPFPPSSCQFPKFSLIYPPSSNVVQLLSESDFTDSHRNMDPRLSPTAATTAVTLTHTYESNFRSKRERER